MNKQAQRGFTLFELLVTLLVMGVLFGIGIPNLLGFVRDNRMAAAANEFVSALYAARSEAVKAQRLVTVCASPDPEVLAPTCGGGGNGGFVVFVDDADGDGIDPTDGNVVIDPGEQIILQRSGPGGSMNVFADSLFAMYAPNGFVTSAALGNSLSTILLCDNRGNLDVGGRSAARVITLSVIGRPQMLRGVADVTNATGTFGWACP